MSNSRGSALMWALIAVFVGLIVTAGITQYVLSEHRSAYGETDRVAALFCAEAGMEQAAELLRTDPTANTIDETALSSSVAGARGTYEVTIEEIPDDPNGYKKITSVGYVPDKANATLKRTVVAVYGKQMFDFGTDAVRARKKVEYCS